MKKPRTQRASNRLTGLDMSHFSGALWTRLVKDMREKKNQETY